MSTRAREPYVSMLQNYLKIAFRNLTRHKGYAFINIFGMAVGLAVCLVILSFVRHELSFDSFHTKADRIYRVAHESSGFNGERNNYARVAAPTGPTLVEAFPEIEQVARLMGGYGEVLIQVGSERFYMDGFTWAEPALFDIFDFPVLRGDPATDLAQPYILFISETAAARLFGDADPLGQVIRYENEQDYIVRGVFQDIPTNSHIRFDFVASLESRFASGMRRDDWNWTSLTYLLLHEGQDAESLEARLPAFMERTYPNYRESWNWEWTLTPLSDIHLYAGLQGEMIPQSDIRYVYLFSSVAFLILLIACINYMNLATAQAARRGREVGIRKVVGADRRQLVRQFMGESLLFSALALGVALALVELLLPWFNRLMDTHLAVSTLIEAREMLMLAGAVAAVGLLAGSYPALYLSAFQPVAVLKGRMPMRSGQALRRGLVVFQFGVSMVLIVCTVVMLRQMQHVRQERPGFSEEQVVIIPTHGELSNHAAFKETLLKNPNVEVVTTSSFDAGEFGYISFIEANDVEGLEGEEQVTLYGFDVGYDFFETYGLELVEGRAFAPSYTTDAAEAILVNETAVKQFGWEEPIGKTIRLPDGIPHVVVGVVKDFHYDSLREEIQPSVFTLRPDATLRFVAAKIQPDDLPQTLAFIQATWDRFVPGRPFDYTFLDEGFDAMYRADERLMHLLASFALLAILVASLGLFGLAAYATTQRTKEIGIRKVLGATVSNMVVLLSKDFVRLVLIAFVAAVPVAYFAMSRWLQDFAYRIEIGPGIFLLAGATVLVIALATVSYQSIKAALADPVKSLRYE